MLNFYKIFRSCNIPFFRGILTAGIFPLTACFASALDWQFNPPHSGRVLDEGGWFQEYNLGSINASPEFNFPLQMVYLNTRANSGLFGPQWYCPQLESSVVPEGNGVFIWQMPSGTIDVFRAEQNSSSDYFDTSRQWFAKYDSDRQLIQNQEGWLYEYRRGHLVAVTSPSNRVLQFTWVGDELQGIQFQGSGADQGMTLLQAAYTDSKRINNLVFGSTQHQFDYLPGRDGRLGDWWAPNKQRLSFTYADVGVLEFINDSTNGIQTFTTQLDDSKLSSSDQKDPAHWRLVQDPDQKYAYTDDAKLPHASTTDRKFTTTSDTGLAVDKDVNLKRGIVTETTAGGVVRKTYYYRAPGQKYDGKLRRIEENGKVMVEYYYSRKSGLLTSMVDEHGTMIYFDYPDNWQPTRENPWDPKPIRIWKGTPDHPQVLAAYQYDVGGHVIAAQDKAGQITRYTYGSRNQLESVTNPQGVTTTVSYDSMGRPVKTQTGSVSQSVAYDDMNRVKSQTTGDVETDFEYDAMGNISKISRKGKVVMEYIRDDTGKVTGIKDALGRVKKVEMDNKGNITADYVPDGSCTKYEYDKFNRRVSQTDGNGNKTTFAYDPAGRLILQTNPFGETIKWEYDKQGRLLTKTTAEQTIKNTYDSDNHLSVLDYGAGQTIAYEYDDQGRVVSAVSVHATAPQAATPQAAADQPATDYRTVLRMLMKAGGHTTDKATATAPQVATYCNYDSLGRVEAIRYVNGQDEQLVRFRCDPSGQRTGLLLAHLRSAVAPVGAQVGKDAQYDVLQQTEYGYDGSGRLSSITNCGQLVVTYQYDAQNRVTKKIFGNGMTADLSYDGLGRLAGIVFSNGPISSPLTLAYEWDASNQVTRRTWNGETQRYEYNLNGQLAKVIDDKSGAVLEAYAYDKAGNMIEKTLNGQKTILTYNAANELTFSTGPFGSVSYSYDKAGRMVGNGMVTNSYGWLDKVIQATTSAGARIAMTYWPDGQLAAEGPASVTGQPDAEHFLWDGLALLRRDDTVYVTEPHPNGGTIIASHPINQPTVLRYYLNDLLGTSLANVANNKIEITPLTSFGQLAANTSPQPVNPSPSTITPPANPLPKTEQISPTGN